MRLRDFLTIIKTWLKTRWKSKTQLFLACLLALLVLADWPHFGFEILALDYIIGLAITGIKSIDREVADGIFRSFL